MAEPTAVPASDPGTPAGTGRRHRPKLAEVGTDPDYRFSLANERTFLAWIRTSLALVAAGVAVVQIGPSLGPRGVRLTIGIALIAFSVALAGVSHRRWAATERAMRLGQTLPPNRVAVVLSYGLAVVAIVMLVVVILGGAG